MCYVSFIHPTEQPMVAEIEHLALAFFRKRHLSQHSEYCRRQARRYLDEAQTNKRALKKLGAY